MAESIELQVFHKVSIENATDIEGYEDLNLEHEPRENIPKLQNNVCKHDDFFTNYNISFDGNVQNKKRLKKKTKKYNVMDIVNSELALIENPIEENAIAVIDHSKQDVEKFLSINYNYKCCHPCNLINAVEFGRNIKESCIEPIFPKIQRDSAALEKIHVQYVPPTAFNVENFKETDVHDLHFLDIKLNKIKLKYHHSLSLEEILVEKLLDVFAEYKNVQSNLSILDRDIKVNRTTKENYKEELLNIVNNKDEIKFDQTFRKYVESVISLKRKFIEYKKLESATLNKLVSLWSDIEMMRLRNKCRKSRYDLDISKSELSDEAYEIEWNKCFCEEFSDLLVKLEYDYVTQYLEYKLQKLETKKGRLSKTLLSKPKIDLNEDEINEQVNDLLKYVISKENINVKIIVNNGNITHKGSKSKKKQYVNKFISIRIFIDDVFVCETETFNLKQNNENIISSYFSVQITSNNKIITLKLYENNIEQSVCSIRINDIKKTNDNAPENKISFKFTKYIEPSTECVGCGYTIKDIANANGVRLKSSNMFHGTVKTIAEMDVKLAWNKEGNLNDVHELRDYYHISKTIKQLNSNNVHSNLLRDVIEKIYEKDIGGNEVLLNVINTVSNYKDGCIWKDGFSIEKGALDTVRIKLLYLRNAGDYCELKNKRIPLHSSQITTEQLNVLQKIKDDNTNAQSLNRERYSQMQPVEILRYMAAKYMRNLNKNVSKYFSDNLTRKCYKDVVCDFKYVSLRAIFRRETNLTALSIFPNGMNHHWLKDANKDVDVYITILKAYNLPDRTTQILMEENEDDVDEDVAGFKMKPLRPFVTVRCQDVCLQSVTAIGCHPTWNQTLRLSTKSEQPLMLEVNIYDEVKVSINDNITEDDHADHSKTAHYRYYNKWLGSVTIPLFAVRSLGKLQGPFKVNSPFTILGYDSTSKSPENHVSSVNRLLKKGIAFLSLQITTSLSQIEITHNQTIAGDNFILKHLNKFISSYEIDFPSRHLSLTFIDSNGMHKCVTQFLQAMPTPYTECFPKNTKQRNESAVSKSSGVSKSSSTKSFESKREAEAVTTPPSIDKEYVYSVYDSRNGKIIEEMEKLMCGYLRYVSLIPCYEVCDQYAVTLTSLEMLKIVYGSPLDHTLLLANYFLFLGIKTWVAIGHGLPRGLSSYALIKYDLRTNKVCMSNECSHGRSRSSIFSRAHNEGWLWYLFDAVSGDKFELRDVSCALKTVLYVFDEENIWVNVQPSLECEKVSFDFTKSSDWRQVFDKNIFITKIPSITDSYTYSTPLDVERLGQKLELKIKEKIQKWRPHTRTIWNRYCSSLLREVLPHWEYWAFNPMEPKPGMGQRLRQLMATYQMFGFPINFPFTSMKSAISIVKSKCIHLNDDPTVEFGLGVEVFSYPNAVTSVWVFLAAISRI